MLIFTPAGIVSKTTKFRSRGFLCPSISMPLVRKASSSLRTCVNSSAWEFQRDSSMRLRKLTFTARSPEVSPATYCWSQASQSFRPLIRRTRGQGRFFITTSGGDFGREARCATAAGRSSNTARACRNILRQTWRRYFDLEFDVTNVSNRIYKIAKESEEIPIQYAPSRTVGGSLKFHF